MKLADLRKLFLNFSITILIVVFSCSLMVKYGDDFMMLFMSFCWMLMAILLYIVIKSEMTTLMFSVFNSFMAGTTIAAYFVKYDNFEMISLSTILLVSVLTAVNYILYTLFSEPRILSKWMIFAWFLTLVLGIYIWGVVASTQGSWIIFLTIIGVSMNFSVMYWNTKNRIFDVYKVIRMYSMLLFGGVLLVVVTVITEGDVLELLDGPSFSRKKKV